MLDPSAIDWQTFQRDIRKQFKSAKDAQRHLLEPLLRLLPRTVQWDGDKAVGPKLTKYIPYKLHPKQQEFLMLDCLDALYGGAAGGGKSVALLAAALQFVDVPGYSALLLRKTYAELNLPGALMSMARTWLADTGAQWKEQEKTWYFSTEGTSATLTFGYLENPNDRYRYQSAAFQSIGLDEMTEFGENDATFLFSRLRRIETMPVPLRYRGATNPTGSGRLWVKSRYVDETTREDRVFIPARLDDNPSLSRDDYIKGMGSIRDPVEREQVLAGNWEISASGKFRRQWFKVVHAIPMGCRFVRYWDFAATEMAPGKDPSWTAGVRIGEVGGQFFIVDIIRDRLTPKGVEDLVLQTAAVDGGMVAIRIEQEPGSSGVGVIASYTKLLAGYDVKGDKVTGPRELRANPLAVQAEAGNVFVYAGRNVKEFLEEIEVFPGGGHDDMVVAACGALNALCDVPVVDTKGIMMVGERMTFDW